jgi:hypothetical protein
MWHKNSVPLTSADRQFIAAAKSRGCLLCYLNVNEHLGFTTTDQLVEYNHHLGARGRLGHQEGTPECLWHHKGEPRDGWAKAGMLKAFGPSRKYQGGKGNFAATYGTDEELREKLRARLLVYFKGMPIAFDEDFG